MNIFFDAVIWFFAIFGVIQFCKYIMESIFEFFRKKEEDQLIVITVKNQQDHIEGILRSVVWKSLNHKRGRQVPNILVVDLGSTDDTYTILERLCKEYQFLAVTDKQGYIDLLLNKKV